MWDIKKTPKVGGYFRRLHSEPTSCLRENQKKEKKIFLKVASSEIFNCNASSKQGF